MSVGANGCSPNDDPRSAIRDTREPRFSVHRRFSPRRRELSSLSLSLSSWRDDRLLSGDENVRERGATEPRRPISFPVLRLINLVNYYAVVHGRGSLSPRDNSILVARLPPSNPPLGRSVSLVKALHESTKFCVPTDFHYDYVSREYLVYGCRI